MDHIAARVTNKRAMILGARLISSTVLESESVYTNYSAKKVANFMCELLFI